MTLSGAGRMDSAVRTSVLDVKTRRGHTRYFGILFGLLTAVSNPVFAATSKTRSMQLPGYKIVPLHYAPLNKMVISASINGHPANLMVDTGADQIIMDASAAASFDVRPSQRGLRYIRFTEINGEVLPVGFAQSLTAGTMNFGSSLVALRNSSISGHFSNRVEAGNPGVDGFLGLDILIRHKAVINCRTKLIFFKVDRSRPLQLTSVALSEKFTKIPLRREKNGALTVPCSIHRQAGRLLVDTGAFVTMLDEGLLKLFGIALQPTPVSAHFTSGVARKINAGRINDLAIGDFRVPPEKLGAAALPNFALQQGDTRINGILGMDLLYICHGIIDFDSMNLFFK
jgi:predicted aspartyl protease